MAFQVFRTFTAQYYHLTCLADSLTTPENSKKEHMKHRPVPTCLLASAAFLASITVANAHHAEFMADKPFIQGLSMPVHGLDHLLSALTVGLLASQTSGSSRFKLPLVFVAITLLGGFLNITGISLPELSVPLATAIAAMHLWSGAGAATASLAIWICILATTNGQALLQSPPSGVGAAIFALGCLAGSAAVCAVGFALGRALKLSSEPLAGRITTAALLIVLSFVALVPELNEALIRFIESPR